MAYFDNAATTFPKHPDVYDFMDRFYRASGASVGRGQYSLSKQNGQLVEETRALVREVLHCPLKHVIFTPTATIALNMIIQGIVKSGVRHIYISPFEHNAVTRTLHYFEERGDIKVHQLAVSQSFQFDLERIRYQFDAVKPELLIVSHASNVFGLVAPIAALCDLAKRYHAITVIDMAQTAGLVDCEMGLDIFDVAVFAGHKTLYGPTGIAGFVMKQGFSLPAALFGGTGYDSANQNMPDSIPEKYEMGTLNIVGIAGLNASLKWLLSVPADEIFLQEKENRQKLLTILSHYDYIHTVGIVDGAEYVGIVSCLIDGISSDSAGSIFDKFGVAVRTGLQCAPLAHRFLGTYPAGTIRFSPGYFTTDEDFSHLEEVLDYIDDNL